MRHNKYTNKLRISTIKPRARRFVLVLSSVVIGFGAVTPFISFDFAGAVSAGPLSATASGDCVNDNSFGTTAWTDPGNAYSDDGTYASMAANNSSNYVKCTNFGFAIPVTATIDGIIVTTDRYASGGVAKNSRDTAVRLVKGGVIGVTDRSTATNYPSSATKEDHGGATDLWGDTWTASNINASNFGAAVAAENYGGFGTRTLFIDVVEITVHYTNVAGAQYDQSSYRIFEDYYAAGNADVGSPIAAQDTAATLSISQTTFRLRFTLEVSQTAASPAAGLFQLEYSEKSGTCDTTFTGESYATVGASTPIAYGTSTYADGAALSSNANDPVNTGTSILQEFDKDGSVDVANSISTGQDGLWDFVLDSSNADPSTSYCIRMAYTGSIELDSYSVVAEVTTPALDFNQSNYRWFKNDDASPDTTFAKAWGGTAADSANSVVGTSDGGYAITGYYNNGTDNDLLIAKFNSSGVEQWSKTWGSTGNDIGNAIIEDSSGNFVVAGTTSSYGAGNTDMALIKFDSSGNLSWSRLRGGSNADTGFGVVETSDGGYVIAGGYYESGTILVEALVAKYTSTGTFSWDRALGGLFLSNEEYTAITEASNGDLIIAGHTNPGSANEDGLLVRLNSSGTQQWLRDFRTTAPYVDYIHAVKETSDGNIIIVGQADSGSDAFTAKLTSSGVITWSRLWGSTGTDVAKSVVEDSDGNFVVAGYTNSYGAGNNDAMVLKYDEDGTNLGAWTWGGTSNDYGHGLVESDDGYMVVGQTSSYGTAGDTVLLKYNTMLAIAGCSTCSSQSTSSSSSGLNVAGGSFTAPGATSATANSPSVTLGSTSASSTTIETGGVGVPYTALGAQNTAVELERRDTPFRLRILLDPLLYAPASSVSVKLQYALRSGTCDTSFSGESFTDVGAGNDFEYYNNSQLTDGSALFGTSSDPTDSNTVVRQEYVESGPITNSYAMGGSTDSGLWDIAITASATASGGDYCFRLVHNTGTAFNSYTTVPELFVAPSMGQRLNQAKWFGSEGTRKPFQLKN